MKEKKTLFTAISLLFVAVIFSFGFSGNDDTPSSLSASNTGGEINVTHGNFFDMVGAWSNGLAIPTPTYFGGGVGYTKNDSGWVFIVAGNGSASGVNTVQKYNVLANTWSTVAPLPQALRLMATAIIGDSLYSIGGVTTTATYVNNVYRYDVNSDTWVPRANFPIVYGFGKAVGYQDSLIYAVGGYDGSVYQPNVRLYNARTNTWREATPMPTGTFAGACTIIGDTIVYVGGATSGGLVSTTHIGVISQSDRSVITWTTGASLPAGNMFRFDAHPWGNKGMILTGGNTTTAFGSVSDFCYTYSPGSDTWTAQPNKTTAWTAGQSGSVQLPGGIWKLVCGSGYNSVPLTSTEIFTDTLAVPPGGNETLVLLHDSTVATGTVQRKADRDTLFKYLPGLVSDYDVVYFTQTTTLPSLSGYKTIILQETSYDNSGNLALGSSARTDLKAWLNSGTSGNKKALISIGGDQGWQYSRIGAANRDTVLSQQLGGYFFRLDNGMGSGAREITGTGIDVGNTRTMTSAPPGGGYWPDGCSFNDAVAEGLYRYRIHTANDTLAAIGKNATGYVFATLFQDPRYFTTGGGFKPVLEALIAYVVSNGGIITGTPTLTSNLPDNYSLSQNYPNPFNPSTKINFSIPQAGLVSIVVYDMLGREVQSLVNENLTAGSYVAEFNGAGLSSGTYFYRLQVGEFVQVKRMVLLK